ncbi:hypothetical protein SISNIDRAFT_546626 [Sistotremastrum niveocremeum HHB9708]|uniref:Uncharacterized protein n=1 Tax=Sistotremastrum niveocremeum HHB9708 TaxID=1314777 RepID=A0A164Z3V8_9AGAM|nr:hypothetical protein SISNIDRAFT_546626 [Sistotremastrum niveocremeum HHB9708]
MCRSCGMYSDAYDMLFSDLFFSGRGRGRSSYGGGFGMGGDVDRTGFATVSERAMNAEHTAERLFLDHLATVDTSKGPVTTEIIQFHLVPDMKKRFNNFVKGYGCTATQRQLTRAEQDKINKSRKSLMIYTSVRVTPQAQQEFLAKKAQKTGGAAASAAPAAKTSATVAPLGDSRKRNAMDAGLDGSSGSDAKKAKPVVSNF